MEEHTKKSVRITFDELANFMKIDPQTIDGGFVAAYSKYIEIYLKEVETKSELTVKHEKGECVFG